MFNARKGTSIQNPFNEEWDNFSNGAFLLIDQRPKRYSAVIRKGTTKYIVVLVELEQVYELMEDVALYRKYAFTDQLTGALTRHGYWAELFELLRLSERMDLNIGIIFADIDNLTLMNTKFGHKGGDLHISEVSKTMARALRKHDLLVRFGGDEFVAILPIRSNQPGILQKVSARILAGIRNNKQLSTTVSMGTHLITTKEVTALLSQKDVKKAWEKYLHVTDKKLYRAKKSGKNQVIS